MPNNLKEAGIEYQDGGPNPSDYVGNPMGYFNDKADMMRAQKGAEMEEWVDPGYPGSGREKRQIKRAEEKVKRKEKRAKKKWERKNIEKINLSRAKYRNSKKDPPKYWQSIAKK